MAVFQEPTQWDHELGNNADVSTLPDDTSATTGVASLQKLFQVINQTPLEAGGVAPSREDFNALFKFLGDSIFYMQNGGLWSYNSAFDYAVGRVVLYTDGNLYKCIQANTSADPKAPTDSAYWTKIPTLSDFDEISFKTGDIKIHTTSTVPNGWLLCNGSAVSRTTYANLFSEIGTTYGTGDGSTTFNIPDLRDRYIIGANTNALGTKIAEQLPNIIGTLQLTDAFFSGVGITDAFTRFGDATTMNSSGNPVSGIYNKCMFKASRANAIYTDYAHVTPLSLALNFIIKA